MKSDAQYQAINNLAYDLWISRGQPLGSPEVDWEQAEQLLQGSDVKSADASSVDVLSFSADPTGDFDRNRSSSLDDEPTQVSGLYGEKDVEGSPSPSPKIPGKDSNGATPRKTRAGRMQDSR